MSDGIIIRNSSELIQIGPDYANLAVYIAATAYLGEGSGNYISVTPEVFEQAVVLIRPSSGNGGFWLQPARGGYGYPDRYLVRGEAANYDYVIMLPSTLLVEPPGDWGIRVLRPDGEVTFSSNFTYPRLIATGSVSGAGVRTLDFYLPASAVKRYAYAPATGVVAAAPPFYAEFISYSFTSNSLIKVEKYNSSGIAMDLNISSQVYGVFEV